MHAHPVARLPQERNDARCDCTPWCRRPTWQLARKVLMQPMTRWILPPIRISANADLHDGDSSVVFRRSKSILMGTKNLETHRRSRPPISRRRAFICARGQRLRIPRCPTALNTKPMPCNRPAPLPSQDRQRRNQTRRWKSNPRDAVRRASASKARCALPHSTARNRNDNLLGSVRMRRR